MGCRNDYTKNKNTIVHYMACDYIALSGYANDYDYHIGSVARVGGDYSC